MAFVDSVVNGLGNLDVAGVSLFQVTDVGFVLAVGVGAFLLGKAAYEKFFDKED